MPIARRAERRRTSSGDDVASAFSRRAIAPEALSCAEIAAPGRAPNTLYRPYRYLQPLDGFFVVLKMSHLFDGYLANPRLFIPKRGKHLLARGRRIEAPKRSQGFVPNAPEAVVARCFTSAAVTASLSFMLPSATAASARSGTSCAVCNWRIHSSGDFWKSRDLRTLFPL